MVRERIHPSTGQFNDKEIFLAVQSFGGKGSGIDVCVDIDTFRYRQFPTKRDTFWWPVLAPEDKVYRRYYKSFSAKLRKEYFQSSSKSIVQVIESLDSDFIMKISRVFA